MAQKRRAVCFHPSPELDEALRNYHASVNPDGNLGDTVRELVGMALASDPMMAISKEVRLSAYKSALRLAYRDFAGAMRAIADGFELGAPNP